MLAVLRYYGSKGYQIAGPVSDRDWLVASAAGASTAQRLRSRSWPSVVIIP
jgi:hypothetical protein